MTRGSTPEAGTTIPGASEDIMTHGFTQEDITTRGTGVHRGTEDIITPDGTTRGTARGGIRGETRGVTTLTGIIRTEGLILRDITTRSLTARHADT